MATPSPMPADPKRSPQRAARELAMQMAKKEPKAPAGSFSYKQYQDMKKKGTYKGIDGMTGMKG